MLQSYAHSTGVMSEMRVRYQQDKINIYSNTDDHSRRSRVKMTTVTEQLPTIEAIITSSNSIADIETTN